MGEHYTAEGRSKRPYRSRADARRAMKQMRSPGGFRNMDAYLCSECGCYHLGHRPGTKETAA